MKTLPEISDEDLLFLAGKVKPLCARGESMKLWDVEISLTVEYLRGTAYMWHPHYVKRAIGYYRIKEINTLHTFGAPVLFKPTVAEVLAQLSPEIVKDIREGDPHCVVAFHIADHISVDVVTCLHRGVPTSVHSATTHLYTKLDPKHQSPQPRIGNENPDRFHSPV